MLRIHFSDKIIFEKNSVKAETFTLGRKNYSFHFRKCDLIFLKKGIVIIPFFNIGKYKFYKEILFINVDSVAGIGKLKKINLNSFGNDVYLEFGEASFTSTNVEIRLKNLNEEEKNLINI